MAATGPARGRTLLQPVIRDSDRVLVLGAGGWFGSTVLDLIGTLLPEGDVLCVAREARSHHVGDRAWDLVTWDERRVRGFEPTIVVNLAFLTRGLAAAMDPQVYEEVNAELTRRFVHALSGPSVRLAVTVSSGAAITEPDHPYGRLKMAEEQAALSCSVPGRAVVVGRAYSVSGPFVRNPQDFAFSTFVAQASTGRIRVLADRPTFRRYADAGEYLALCIRRGLDGFSGVIESGGDLVEIGELARLVADAAGPGVSVSRVDQVSQEPSVYASDDADWRRHCATVGFEPSPLIEQVAAAVRRNRGETVAPR